MIAGEEMHRFKVRCKDVGNYLVPDVEKLTNIVRSYGIFDREVFYDQSYIWIATVLLHYFEDEKETFAVFAWLFHTLEWRNHCLEPYTRSQDIV